MWDNKLCGVVYAKEAYFVKVLLWMFQILLLKQLDEEYV